MKRLLLPLAILFAIPFNTSCIREITFNVNITCENCSHEEPVKKASMGKDYNIKVIPYDGFTLSSSDFTIKVKSLDISFFNFYNEETQTLTISGTYVTGDITITASAYPDELVR